MLTVHGQPGNMMSARSFLVSRHTQHHPPPPQPRPPAAAKGNESYRVAAASTASTVKTTPSTPVMTPTREAPAKKPPMPSPPSASTAPAQPITPSTPVQIPARPKSRDATTHPQKPLRHHHGDCKERPVPRRRPRDVHSPDAIPPSVAALLAITNIPPPRAGRSARQVKEETRMTVESIIERAQESEKALSLKLSRSPLDILLAAPEDLEADDACVCDNASGSVTSGQTVSLDSTPSLSNSFTTTETPSSLETPHTPARRRKARPTRRSLEPVSPPGELENHPLSGPDVEFDELDFRVFASKEEEPPDKKASRLPFKPLKSAFKSNLTASLRALRQAARSFSNLNFSSIPPEDFLTRSILTIDPQVPYTDERRPPLLEEEPPAALRRYLNPTTTARLEKHQAFASGPALRTFTASIQMQTYKVHRARGVSPGPGGRSPSPSAGPSSAAQAPQAAQPKPASTSTVYAMPGPRQREMRENPDFIRIAVMEMAMRKSGKLDDQRPGRARWALPPRKPNTKPYEIGPDGVPARWVAATY